MNKDDIFTEKVKNVDLGDFFPEYTGGCDREATLAYIAEQFYKRRRNDRYYSHVTTAINTESIKFVWKAVKNVLVADKLRQSGMGGDDLL